MNKFKNKLNKAKEQDEEEQSNDQASKTDVDVDIDDEKTWLAHKLRFVSDTPVLAKDASTKDDDWFEIYDPRNPLNKRRRGEKTHKKK